MKESRKRVTAPRRGFRVDNRTKWSTADLRKLIAEVIKRQGGPPHGFVVKVTTGGYSGQAYVGGSWMCVRVPAPPIPRGETSSGEPLWWFNRMLFRQQSFDRCRPDPRQLVSIVAHELAHLRGLSGERDMRSSKWLGHRKGHDHYAWADTYPIRRAETKKPMRLVGADADEKKRSAAEGKVLQWERKAKLAATKLKAWRGKVRYYERKVAARAAAKEKG